MFFTVLTFLCGVCRGSVGAPRVDQCHAEHTPPLFGEAYSIQKLYSLPNAKENIQRLAIVEGLQRFKKKGRDEKIATLFQETLVSVLLKNATSSVATTELALWINSLISKGENPRNFRGVDLVSHLLYKVNTESHTHPYLLLTLCNARAIAAHHLTKVKNYIVHGFINSSFTSKAVEMTALGLSTLECAKSLPNAPSLKVDEFQDLAEDMAARLASVQKDGHFGNVYTTSLAVQALTAHGGHQRWDENDALDYLRQESQTIDSTQKAYYIAMGLHARRVPFLWHLYSGPYGPYEKTIEQEIVVNLAMKNEQNPSLDFAITLKVRSGMNLFEVMEAAAELSVRFKFACNGDRDAPIYELDGQANDPELGLYWLICRIKSEPFPTNGFYVPHSLYPYNGETIVLWYRSTDCPPRIQVA